MARLLGIQAHLRVGGPGHSLGWADKQDVQPRWIWECRIAWEDGVLKDSSGWADALATHPEPGPRLRGQHVQAKNYKHFNFEKTSSDSHFW